MKKSIVKMLSVIMALCLFIATMPVMSFAQDEPDGYVVVDPIDAIDFSPEVQLEIPEGVTDEFEANKFYGATSDADTPYLFYNQLTSNQKYWYSIIKDAGISEQVTSSLYYYGDGATQAEAVQAAKAQITNDVAAAITAVTEDNPLIFWINGFGYSFGFGTTTTETGCSIRAYNITLTLSLDTNSYANFTVVQECYDQLVETVNNFEVNGITRFEKVKSINDTLCDMVTYPEQQGTFSDGSPWYGPMAHQPTGALLNGSAVCEGYAEAFKLICDREGIPCITVLGTGNGGAHKWNYVKMEDGKWYLVDATWNDQGDIVFNDYLLSGADTMTPHFEPSATDKTIHIPQGQMYSGVSFALQYPTLSDDAYGMIMLNYNVGDITLEDSMNVIFVGKDIITVQNSFTLPSDFSASITSFTDLTGGKLTVTKTATGTSKTYIIAKRGDIDGSNTTNITDYNKVVTASTLGECPSKNTAEYYAGDINHDGAIDGFDAIALDLYLNDTITFN